MRVFISYRRADAQYPADHIRERLAKKFGRESVFMDIDSIPSGVDFRQHVSNSIKDCDIMLAIIGKGWLGEDPNNAQRRIDSPADYVRNEVEAAMASNVKVIPVYVGGRTPLQAQELPESISKLAYLNALTFRAGIDSNRDLNRLVVEIAREKSSTKRWILAATVPAAMLVTLVAFVLFKNFPLSSVQSTDQASGSASLPASESKPAGIYYVSFQQLTFKNEVRTRTWTEGDGKVREGSYMVEVPVDGGAGNCMSLTPPKIEKVQKASQELYKIDYEYGGQKLTAYSSTSPVIRFDVVKVLENP